MIRSSLLTTTTNVRVSASFIQATIDEARSSALMPLAPTTRLAALLKKITTLDLQAASRSLFDYPRSSTTFRIVQPDGGIVFVTETGKILTDESGHQFTP